MRFGLLAGIVALVGFLAGYGSSRESLPDRPTAKSFAKLPKENTPAAEPPPRPEPVFLPTSSPDLLAALEPSIDLIRRGDRILRAIEGLDAPALADLFTPPVSQKLRQLLDEDSRSQEAVIQRAMARWIELDPAAALAWLPQAMSAFSRNGEAYLDGCTSNALGLIARRFPEEAVAFAVGLSAKGSTRYSVLHRIVESIAAENPARAYALVLRCPTAEMKETAMHAYWDGFAKADAFAAIAQATALDGQLARSTVLRGVDCGGWSPRRFAEFCEILNAKERPYLMDSFARANPAAAARLIEQYVAIDSEDFSSNALFTVASWYGRRDGERGIEWANRLPEKIRMGALGLLAGYWAERDPAAVVAGLGKLLPEESSYCAALGGALPNWIEQDSAAALAWIDMLPPGEVRGTGESAAIRTLPRLGLPEEALMRYSRVDPAIAASIDIGEWIEGFNADTAIDVFARSNPRRLADWSLFFAETGHAFPSVGKVIRTWFKADPASAGAWVTALPAGRARDEAAASCAVVVSRVDEAAADEWLQWVMDPQRRTKAADTVAQEMSQRDPNGARAWRERFETSPRP